MSKESTQEVEATAPQASQSEAAIEPESESDKAPLGVDELSAALEEARARCDEQAEAVLRARAELDNVRKRAERDLSNARKFALERFVQELLPVKDSMEMGLAAAGEEGADVARLREGSELTLRMLGTAIEKFGVSEVDPQGETFNPERHQAISTMEAPGAGAGTVLTVVQKGYLLNDRLVRPAMVIVAK